MHIEFYRFPPLFFSFRQSDTTSVYMILYMKNRIYDILEVKSKNPCHRFVATDDYADYGMISSHYIDLYSLCCFKED
jgi:hypothetical protein